MTHKQLYRVWAATKYAIGESPETLRSRLDEVRHILGIPEEWDLPCPVPGCILTAGHDELFDTAHQQIVYA